MKPLLKAALLSVLVSAVCGCTSSDRKFETRFRPPDSFNPHFMSYKELPNPKVCVVAVDASGEWAFGYSSAGTLEEAARRASLNCDLQRDRLRIFNKAKLFAVNDEIVYYNNK